MWLGPKSIAADIIKLKRKAVNISSAPCVVFMIVTVGVEIVFKDF